MKWTSKFGKVRVRLAKLLLAGNDTWRGRAKRCTE